jgi:hypothetical protein
LVILPRPNTGQQSPTTTGPLRRAHLIIDDLNHQRQPAHALRQ